MVALRLAHALRQRRQHGRARRIVLPVALGYRPLHHRADPLAHPRGGLPLGRPDGQHRRQHVGRRDLVDAHGAERGERVAGERLLPLPPRLPRVLPAARLDVDHRGRGRGEVRDVAPRPESQRIAALPREGPVVERLPPRVRQAHERVAPEPERPLPPVDHDALHPRLGPAGLDAEHEPVPVRVAFRALRAPRVLYRPDEGGREPVGLSSHCWGFLLC